MTQKTVFQCDKKIFLLSNIITEFNLIIWFKSTKKISHLTMVELLNSDISHIHTPYHCVEKYAQVKILN